MARKLPLWRRKARAFFRFAKSRRSIPIIKGTIAYLLAVILVFIKPFDRFLKTSPIVYTSMIIVTIAGQPGKSMGACLQALAFALFGIGMGAVGFVILANLGHAPIAQGFVLAVFVYFMALLKARGLRWFPCALLAILMAFNGIYTSILLKGAFSRRYLEDYLIAYAWGAAIVLGVNVLIVPISSEKELRKTLVTSLEHVATFSHLLAKTYRLEITAEERVLREQLSQTIRADFGFLRQKISETSLEINYSRFSMKEYRGFVAQLRIMQQALITAHSSLQGVDNKDVDLFRERFLPGTAVSFCKLRRAVDLSIREIGKQLGCGPMTIAATQAQYVEFMDRLDLEDQSTLVALAGTDDQSDYEVEEQLEAVSRRLAEEVKSGANTPDTGEKDDRLADSETREESDDMSSIPPTVTLRDPSALPTTMAPTPTAVGSIPRVSAPSRGEKSILTKSNVSQVASRLHECGVERLQRLFEEFSDSQHAIFQQILVVGIHGDDDSLRLHSPLPSLYSIYGPDIRNALADEADDYPNLSGVRNRKPGAKPRLDASIEDVDPEGIDVASEEQKKADIQNQATHHSLLRVYAFMFAMGNFVDAIETLYRTSMPKPKKLHIHLYETFNRPHAGTDADGEKEISLREAYAILENKKYEPIKRKFWQGLDSIEHLIRSPTSVYAAKTAAAASVFALLILVKKPQSWFLNYGMTSGLLTIVVALAPTLGQSIATFVLQITGSGLGYLYGLAVLEIFRNVGGFTYNPYGMVCLLVPFALYLSYVLYESPKFFVISFLAMNAAAILILTEWLYNEVLHVKFDKPPLRTGKAIASLCVALTLVGVFQLFVLRNPARRTLRQRLAHSVQSNLSLLVLLQAYVRAAIPADAESRASPAALRRVEKELQHRELKIQAELIELNPLVVFAAAEPQYSRPFQAGLINKIIRSNQIILDRIREARTALGTDPMDYFILTEFVAPLSTYRRLNYRLMKNSLFIVATSLASKTPLPHESLQRFSRHHDFWHDALVVSTRFARAPEGMLSIKKGAFLRYWAFLMCMVSLAEQLAVLEKLTKELMGELETKLL